MGIHRAPWLWTKHPCSKWTLFCALLPHRTLLETFLLMHTFVDLALTHVDFNVEHDTCGELGAKFLDIETGKYEPSVSKCVPLYPTLSCGLGTDVLEWPHNVGGRGVPPLDPPPLDPTHPPFPIFQAASQNFASVPLAPRSFKLQFFWPTFGGDHRATQGGGASKPKPPPPPLRPPNPPVLIHRRL